MRVWRPILDGDAADRALAAAGDVVAALAQPSPELAADPSLGRGTAGVALCHAAYGAATGDGAATERAVALLDDAVDRVVSADRVDPAFMSGIVGVGWAVSRVATLIGEADDDEDDVDRLVARAVGAGPWPGHFDLVTGLVGLGTYALERLPRPSARAALDGVVAQLAALAERPADGVTWLTTPERYRARDTAHYDLGVAHGVAGVVAFLAAATGAGAAGAAPLLRDAARWLAAQGTLPGGDQGRFPAIVAPGTPVTGTRLAWCYGDPGVAVALHAAGAALADESLTALARDVARGCAGRVASSGVVEASLCHGTAGAAHVFNRLGQALGDEELLDLARFWLGAALDSRATGDGIAGLPRHPPVPGVPEPHAMPGFLEGAAGTALALVAAATPAEPFWDAALLLSAP